MQARAETAGEYFRCVRLLCILTQENDGVCRPRGLEYYHIHLWFQSRHIVVGYGNLACNNCALLAPCLPMYHQ